MGRSCMLAVLTCAALVGLCQAAPSFDIGRVPALEAGGEAEMPIIMTDTDAGISGYNITFSLSDAATAQIVAVTFPGWAGLHRNGSLPAGSVWVEAVDLSNGAEAGGSSITLCTLTLKGVRAGSMVLRIVPGEVQDDEGETVTVADAGIGVVVAGAVTWDGNDDSPSQTTTVATTVIETSETPTEIPALPESQTATTAVSLTVQQETPADRTTSPEPQSSSGPLVLILFLSLLIGYLIRNLE